ncbi:MAG: hypothetical protein KBS57_01135 [Alistipes sp.]|nr:hypothetical protein [Candidatus Minthomonas equi]
MRIIILRPSHPYRGGIAAFDERLAQELICGGKEVELWTFRLQNPSFLFPGKTQFSTGPAPEGLTVRRVVHSINPFNWISVGMKLRKAEAAAVAGTIVKFYEKMGRKPLPKALWKKRKNIRGKGCAEQLMICMKRYAA